MSDADDLVRRDDVMLDELLTQLRSASGYPPFINECAGRAIESLRDALAARDRSIAAPEGELRVSVLRAESAENGWRNAEARVFSLSEANDMLLSRAEAAEARAAAAEAVIAAADAMRAAESSRRELARRGVSRDHNGFVAAYDTARADYAARGAK